MIQAFTEASANYELHKKFPVGMKHTGSLCSQMPVIRFCLDLQNEVHTVRVCQTNSSRGVHETQFGVYLFVSCVIFK
jgi:hypothetical protein